MNWKLYKCVGLYLLLLSGVPVLDRPQGGRRWPHRMLTAYGLLSHAFAVLWYTTDRTPYFSFAHNDAARSYVLAVSEIITVGKLLAYLFTLKQLEAIQGHIARSNFLLERLTQFELDTTKRKFLVSIGTGFITCFSLIIFIDSKNFVTDVFGVLFDATNVGISIAKTVAAIVLIAPAYMQYWANYYNMTTAYLLELEATEKVHQILLTRPQSNEVDETPFLDLFGPKVLYRADAPELPVPSCEDALKIISQLKNVRLLKNRAYYLPVFFLAVAACLWYPVQVIDLIFSGRDVNKSTLAKAGRWIALSLSTIVQMAPFVLNQVSQYRRQCLAPHVLREVFASQDPQRRRILAKVLVSVRDPFPDSPCILLPIDVTLWPVLIDALVLIFTTFLSQ